MFLVLSYHQIILIQTGRPNFRPEKKLFRRSAIQLDVVVEHTVDYCNGNLINVLDFSVLGVHVVDRTLLGKAVLKITKIGAIVGVLPVGETAADVPNQNHTAH